MFISRKWSGMVLALALFVLSACSPEGAYLPGSSPNQPATDTPAATARIDPGAPRGETMVPKSPDGLANTRWVLISYGKPGSESPVIAGSALTLEFGAAGQVVGNGGCNTFGSQYKVKGTGITFGPVNSTMKACTDNNLMQQEQQYFQALQQAATFTMKGDRMLIFYNQSQGVMNFIQSKSQTLVLPAANS